MTRFFDVAPDLEKLLHPKSALVSAHVQDQKLQAVLFDYSEIFRLHSPYEVLQYVMSEVGLSIDEAVSRLAHNDRVPLTYKSWLCELVRGKIC